MCFKHISHVPCHNELTTLSFCVDMATSSPEIKTKKPKKGGHLCAAINCHNCHCNSRVSLFQFPKAKERSKQWVINIQRADLESYSAMRVNLAAQVLSHSVAAGISTLVCLKYLPECASDTAQFIEHFDALFNTFNSRVFRSLQRLGHAFNDSSGHHPFLQKSLNFLENIKTLEGKELPCIFGWKLCTQALLGLWEYLKGENFQYILTSRLNQDCIENLFSIIRGKGGHQDNPDPQQFKDAFKYVVGDKLFVQSYKSSCKIDHDKILLDITSVALGKYIKPMPENIEKPPETDVAMLLKPPIELPEENVATYLAGYLLCKLPVDECQVCSAELKISHLPPTSEGLSVYELLRNKTYQEAGCLIYPSPTMTKFVLSLEKTFCAIFEQIIYMLYILTRLCKSVEEYCQCVTCENLQCSIRLKNMTKLYMKVRFFHALKQINAKNCEEKGIKCNRKMLKLSHL